MDRDQKYMMEVIQLAKKALGQTSPNPYVGALFERDGEVLGRGYHSKSGADHAEIEAIKDAHQNGQDLKGATLYCNLEPCCHTQKKTPPCAPELLKLGLAKVVVANLDPNPEVSGAGIKALRDNGLEVVTGVCQKEGEDLNEVFFLSMTKGRPFIHLKVAQTLDGNMATRSGESKWITNEESRRKVHLYRGIYDSVMIGMTTLFQDNPKLDIRQKFEWDFPQPKRIILGRISRLKGLDLDQFSIFDQETGGRVYCVTQEAPYQSEEVVAQLEKKGVTICHLPSIGPFVPFAELWKYLWQEKIHSVLVEGGPQMVSSLIKGRWADKASFFVAPKIFGQGLGAIGDLEIPHISQAITFSDFRLEVLGDNALFSGRPIYQSVLEAEQPQPQSQGKGSSGPSNA